MCSSDLTTDIRPRVVLDEWLSQGLVSLDGQDRVVLNATAYLPKPGGEEQVFFLGRNLHDHVAAGAGNVMAEDKPPFLDRAAHYDRVSPETARQIEIEARQIVDRALQDVNRMALALIDAEEAAAQPGASVGARVNVGVYIYREDGVPPA